MEVTASHPKSWYVLKAILFCIVFTVILIVLSFFKGFIPASYERFAHGVVGTIAAFITTILFLKLDKIRFADIGLVIQKDTVIRFVIGVLAGVVIMGLMAASVLYIAGVKISLNPHGNILHFLLATSFIFLLAFMEELGFRAYPLELLKNKVGVVWAIVITSLLFGLYHIPNGWSVATALSGPALWGLLFGLAAVYSRGIAMPTGIHYAANLTTSAFEEGPNTTSLWTLTQPDPLTVSDTEKIFYTIIPVLILLTITAVCFLLYRKTQTARTKLTTNL